MRLYERTECLGAIYYGIGYRAIVESLDPNQSYGHEAQPSLWLNKGLELLDPGPPLE